MIRFELLGTPCWHGDGGDPVPLAAKDAALLAILALEGPQARDALASRLWPQVDHKHATDSLRQRVLRLRKASGERLFRTGATLSLESSTWVDVNHLEEASAASLLAAGELLAGQLYPDSDELDAWVTEQRLAMRRRRAQALGPHAQQHEAADEIAAALQLAEAIVALAPLSEHHWRRLMRLHYLRGDYAAAVAAYERFETLLHAESLVPGAEIVSLLKTVEAARQPGATAQRTLPAALLRPPVMVGRAAVLAQLHAAWAGGQAVLVLGDAGLGKTRLLEEALRDRTGVVAERGRPGDVNEPYAVLARVLAAAKARHAPALAREQTAALACLDGGAFGPAPAAPVPQGALWRAAETLLAAAMAGGLDTLAVDDLHYADPATLEALRWLCASPVLQGLHVVLACRPLDDVPAGTFLREWLEDSRRPVPLVLEPLAPAELQALLDTLGLPLREDSARRLLERAAGHPLLTLESLRQAWLQGRAPGRAEGPPPARVQALLERRLAGLGAGALELLRVAAVAGPDLNAQRAARLLGRSVLALADDWAELERAQVMEGTRFVHDLMRDAAQRLVPRAVGQALHAALAALLAEDPQVSPSRVAEHWEAGGHAAEAGRAWLAAAARARMAGRLDEQRRLLASAAAAFRQGGDSAGEFDALLAGLESELLRHGGAAVLAALPQLDALAVDPERRLRGELVRVKALLYLERPQSAALSVETALQATQGHPQLRAEALALHAYALAQSGHHDEAVKAAHAAVAQASAGSATALQATGSLAYALYRADRIGEALPVQQDQLRQADALGDRAEAATAEGSLAALWSVAGHVEATYRHACAVRQRYRDMGLGSDSAELAINLVNLGRSAMALGRFDEALPALEQAVANTGREAMAGMQAKTRIALATLWLRLGRAERTLATLADLAPGMPPAMQVQHQWLLALAALMQGRDPAPHWAELARVHGTPAEANYLRFSWVEWSYQGDPLAVVQALRPVREHCDRRGLPGAARSLQARMLARLNEIDGREAEALALAVELLPHAERGLSAHSYPPETWATIACAFERAGQPEQARASRRAGLDWIEGIALPRVPPDCRADFLEREPAHRVLRAHAP